MTRDVITRRLARWGEPYLVVLTIEDDDDAPDYEGDIFTCSGCGAYAGTTGPHLGCRAEGEFL